MTKKVYCKDCKWFKPLPMYTMRGTAKCNHPHNLVAVYSEEDYESPSHKLYDKQLHHPKEINFNNMCSDYVPIKTNKQKKELYTNSIMNEDYEEK